MARMRKALVGGVLVVALGGAVGRADAGPPADGQVSGLVTDALTGRPVGAASVTLAASALHVVAGSDGRFVLVTVPAGPAVLDVGAPGYETERLEVVVEADAAVKLEIALLPSIDRMASARVALWAEAQQRALEQQRAAPNITTVVAADQLGRFPDGNAAEALQRVAGVSIRLDRGEGREVLVRGVAPRLNSVTLDGDRLPSTEDDKRSVDLDVIPADLLQSVAVAKTLLPASDGDSIGGSINLFMADVPRRPAWTFSLASGYDELTRSLEQASGTLSGGGRTLGGRLGVHAGASAVAGTRGADGARASYAASGPTDIRVVKYLVDRRRVGLNVATEYQVSQNATAFLRGAFASYAVAQEQQTLRHRLSSSRLERELDRDERDEAITLIAAGAQHALARGAALDYRLSFGYAHEDRPDELDVDFTRSLPLTAPAVALTSTTFGPAEDTSAFRLRDVDIDSQFSDDRDIGGALNVAIPVGRAGALFKGGAKYWAKRKGRTRTGSEAVLGDPSTLAEFVGSGPAFFGGIGPVVSARLVNGFLGRLSYVENVEEAAADYAAHEHAIGGYAMVELPLTPNLTIIPGARFEYSAHRYSGRDFDGAVARPLTASGSDQVWLPGVHVRYATGKDTIVRAAVTRSFARPDFEDLVPYRVTDGSDVWRGNPFLKPTLSWNADLAVEQYLPSLGVVSVGAFAKRLDHYVYAFHTSSLAGGETVEVTQPQNGDAATIAGIEVTYQQRLEMLPAPFNAFGVYATYTRSASKARYPSRTGPAAPLPEQTPHAGSVSVAYERSGFSARTALSFHGQYLRRIRDSAVSDELVDGRSQLDLSIAQAVGRRVWVVFDLDNMTDSVRTTFRGAPTQPTSMERFGRYATFGVRMMF